MPGVATFFETRLTGLHDPETLPGVVEAADRIVAAIRDRKKIVIYGDYDVDGVCGTSILWACLKLAGAEDVSILHPAPRRGRLRRQRRGPPQARDRARGRADHHRRLRDLGGPRGEAGPRAGRRADHHRSPHDRPRAARGRRPGPPQAGREPLPVPRALRLRRGVQAGLAGLQGLRRRQEGVAAPPRLPGQVDRPGRDGDRRRRHADPRREPDPGPPRPGRPGRLAQPGAPGVDVGRRVPGQAGAEHRDRSASASPRGSTPPAGSNGRCRPSRCSRPTLDDRAEELAQALDLCNTQRQEVERRIVDEAHEMITAQGGLEGSGGDRPRPRRLASRRDRDRRQPPGRHLPPADDRRGPRRRSTARGRPGRSPASTSTRRSRACSDGLDRLRRPRRGGRAEDPPRATSTPSPRRSTHHCRGVLSAEQLQKSIHDRRRGAARRS